jgi:hypothetical protein
MASFSAEFKLFQRAVLALRHGHEWTSTASNTLVVNSGDALSFQ